MARRVTSYISEYAIFMADFLKQHPEIAADQVSGHARLWHTSLDQVEQSGFEASKVPVNPYAYQKD